MRYYLYEEFYSEDCICQETGCTICNLFFDLDWEKQKNDRISSSSNRHHLISNLPRRRI